MQGRWWRWLGILGLWLLVGGVVARIEVASHRQTGPLPGYRTLPGEPTAVLRPPATRGSQAVPTRLYLPQTFRQAQPLSAMQLTYGVISVTQPALSPDGQTLLYLRTEAEQQDLYRQNLATGELANLTQTATAQEETPVFSPDGKTIAFASDRRGDWDIYLLDADGQNLRLGVGLTESDELQPAFTPDGGHLLFSSNRAAQNWDIYSATIGSTVWTRLTTDLTVERFPTIAADGSLIAFRRELSHSVSNTVNSEIFVMGADGSDPQRITDEPGFDGYPIVTPDGSGVLFLSNRRGQWALYTANLGGIVQPLVAWPPPGQVQTPRLTADGRTLVFAASAEGAQQIYSRPYRSPLATVGERGFLGLAGNCDWEAGVLAYGWGKAWQATADPSYRQWLVSWVDGCLAAHEPVDHVNDGLLGYAALIAYQHTNQARYLAFAEEVAAYLLDTAKRTGDGTLAHLNDDTVWDDTLVSVIPFLVEMGRVSHNSRYWDEAATQLVQHAVHLQNAQTHLYHHAWQESSNSLIGASYWCRGNSWPMVAAVELLQVLPIHHAQRPIILANFQRQAQALLPLQAAAGLWPTVVDQPDFYRESSGSAMIAAGLQAGLAAGWLDQATFQPAAQRARLALWQQVQADGTVNGVSAPTGPMRNAVDYNVIPVAPFALYGQGAMLLLGAASLH